MKRQEITTTNLADFGSRERKMLIELLVAWREQGLPEGFDGDKVHPMMNRNSGAVFLTNSEYEVAMMNGSKLEMWHWCLNCGREGFAGDLHVNDEGCNECYEKEEQDDDGND